MPRFQGQRLSFLSYHNRTLCGFPPVFRLPAGSGHYTDKRFVPRFLLSMYGFQRHHNHNGTVSLRPFGFLTACPGHHTHNGTVRSHAPALFFPW